MKHMTLAMLFVLATSLAFAFNAAADQSANELLQEAQRALDAKDYDKAIELYGKSHDLLPLNAEIPYNLAVAQYRKGEYDKAAESLKQSIALSNDANLRARSVYNLGNAAYAQTLKALAGQADPNQAAAQMNDAQQHLKEAIDQYKKAIDADPKDEDAKANAELSQRWLTELQKLQQKQQQQQQQQQNQQQQQQQQNPQSQPSQSQSQPSSQPQDSKQQPQTRPTTQPQQNQNQDQNNDQNKDQNKDNSKDQDQQNKGDQKDKPQPPPATQKDQGADQKAGDKKGMSREAAERLLQAVRDKERQRRAELARREAAKYAPADKDW